MKTTKNFEYTIKSKVPMILRGIFLVALGTSLFWINSNTTVNLLLPILLALLAGISGLAFIQKNKIATVPKNWLMIESIADIVLGLTFIYMQVQGENGIENLRDVFAGFAILFAFMQFTYMFQIAITDFKRNTKVLLFRGLSAVGFGMFGAVLFMQGNNEVLTFLINAIGAGPIIAGIGCIFLIMYSFRKQP
ncbi:MAG: hypothetical protein EAS52_15725 [Parapedobacter sp.]|nr:MAG: hypothetical protein EAS52_15725 [Parapedobacter sp.]